LKEDMSVHAAEAPLETTASLAGPFALLGAVGGGLVGYHFLRGWPIPAEDGPLVEVLAMLVAAGAGFLVGRTASRVTDRDRPADSIVALTIATLLLWGAGGGLVGIVYAALGGRMIVNGEPRGVPVVETMLVGLLHGIGYALMFLPAFMCVLIVALRVGRARRGSVVDAADRRAVWLATALVLSVAACTASCLAPGARMATDGVGLLSVGAIMLVLLLDVRALEALVSELTDLQAGYLRLDRGTLAFRENLMAARRELVRALLADGAALVASAAALLAAVKLARI
jgi:hypothetical protein